MVIPEKLDDAVGTIKVPPVELCNGTEVGEVKERSLIQLAKSVVFGLNTQAAPGNPFLIKLHSLLRMQSTRQSLAGHVLHDAHKFMCHNRQLLEQRY